MSAFAALGLVSGSIVEALLWTSLQGALFIAVVWLVCRLFPRLPAALRCGLWWAACLKLLVGLVWISPVELPLLPASQALTSPALLSRPLPPTHIGRGERTAEKNVADSAAAGRRIFFPSPGEGGREGAGDGAGVRVLALLWLAGLALQAARSIGQLRHARWVVRRAEPIREGWIQTTFAELCARLALRRRPELHSSRDVQTPQALGLVRPRVLLPDSGLARLSPTEVSMTLCHELVHLRRGDLWLGWVPALAHRLFFFHPLAALAVREYAIAREAACDAEVLRVLGSAPQAYGRLLLRWGVAPRETGLAAAGASPSLQNLKRRLQMLQQISEKKRGLSGWWWLAAAAVVVGLIPLRIVAQQPVPAESAVEAEAPVATEDAVEPEEPVVAVEPAAPVAVVEPEEPVAVVEGISGGIEDGVVGGIAGGIPGGVEGGVPGGVEGGVPGAAAPVMVRPALAPRPGRASAPGRPVIAPVPAGPVPVGGSPALARAPLPGAGPVKAASPAGAPRAASGDSKKHGYSVHFSGNGDSYVLLYGNGSSTMSGSWRDLEKVKRLRGDSKESILWFEHEGREYVVRDAAVLKQAREIFRPQMELGARQGELGALQGELGAKQGALGAQQGALGGQQGALGAQLAAIAVQRIGEDDDAAIERRERDLEMKMEELSQQQEELGRQQEALGRQQEALGERQEELGRQQEAASEKAQRELRVLMEKAIRSGVAQEVR